MLNEQTGWPTIPGKFSWVNSSGGLGRPTTPVLEKIGVAGPPLIRSPYPSAHQQAPSTMPSLYGLGAQCWSVIPTNCPDFSTSNSIPLLENFLHCRSSVGTSMLWAWQAVMTYLLLILGKPMAHTWTPSLLLLSCAQVASAISVTLVW